jgi:NADP-dependent 3-hydroxy acid dehydrogenase YdfG
MSQQIMQHLQYRTAVITGAASGLGAAMAKHLALAGFQVAITDRDLQQAQALLDQHAFPAGSFAAELDVNDAQHWQQLLSQVQSQWPGLGLLINNAGVAAAGPIQDDPLANWRWLFDINVFGVTAGCQTFLPLLLQQNNGHIINIASFAALAGAPAQSNYGASKAAVLALSESLYTELAASEVAVSVACPAFIQTALLDNMRVPVDSYKQRAARWMQASGVSADDFARLVFTAAGKRRFLILTHTNTRWMWRLKRWFPAVYYALLRRNVRHQAQRRGKQT